MNDKVEQYLKYLPVATLICYFFGFIIFKSFLLQNGIVETEIVNLRYLQAGICFLLVAPFIIATPFITNRKLNYFGSISTALFAFFIYDIIFHGTHESWETKAKFYFSIFLLVSG